MSYFKNSEQTISTYFIVLKHVDQGIPWTVLRVILYLFNKIFLNFNLELFSFHIYFLE